MRTLAVKVRCPEDHLWIQPITVVVSGWCGWCGGKYAVEDMHASLTLVPKDSLSSENLFRACEHDTIVPDELDGTDRDAPDCRIG